MVWAADSLVAEEFVPANTALTECEPGLRYRFRLAVPLADNCAVPSTDGPSQYLAVASQNSTNPAVTTLPLLLTCAVKVSGVPNPLAGLVMLVDDTVKVVAVAAACANDMGPRATAETKIPSNHAKVLTAAPDARRSVMYFFV